MNEEQRVTAYWNNVTTEPHIFFIYVQMIWTLILWTRALLLLRGSRFFGPLVNIFFSMLRDLAQFMVLFGIIFWIFLCVGTGMMADTKEDPEDDSEENHELG